MAAFPRTITYYRIKLICKTVGENGVPMWREELLPETIWEYSDAMLQAQEEMTAGADEVQFAYPVRCTDLRI